MKHERWCSELRVYMDRYMVGGEATMMGARIRGRGSLSHLELIICPASGKG
jgi:hypothetical protein